MKRLCEFIVERGKFICIHCKQSHPFGPYIPHRHCRAEIQPTARKAVSSVEDPGFGPGAELWGIFKELRIRTPRRCSCKRLRAWMNVIGPEMCRVRKNDITSSIKKNAKRWGIADKIMSLGSAMVRSVITGLIFKIDPTDPIPGLVEEAIIRAERKQEPIIKES